MKLRIAVLRLAWACGAGVACFGLAAATAAPRERPNILWITSEDHGPHLGCYGDTYASTPHVDALAARGLRYARVWSCAPVCAPARTVIISGLYASSTGAEHMRSLVPLPRGKRMFPQYLREAGYYCSNNAKEDYNLEKTGPIWDESSRTAHWRHRASGQPFFAVFNSEKSHESRIRSRPHQAVHDPARVRVPAYHPDTPEVRRDWAQYYDAVSHADADAGARLRELEAAGLAESTIVFYYADHGSGMPRSKRWPFNSGLHVPLIVHVPDRFRDLAPPEYRPGGQSDRLVSFVDLAPTMLSLAGVRPPDWMHGRAFMGRYERPAPDYLHGFRGRMDERYDLVRSTTDGRFVYVRNYMPHLPYGQHINYMFQTPTTRVWRELFAAGKLNAAQAAFWERKDPELLFDLRADPDETRNLAGLPEHRASLRRFRAAQRAHLLGVRDAGFLPEDEMHRRANGGAIYDMAEDPRRYDLKRILDMADAASLLDPGALAKLQSGLKERDSAVRYWAALGLLMRGAQAIESSRLPLRGALRDPAPSVRAIAARALGEFGGAEDLDAALAALKDLISPQAHGVYTAMLAMNCLDALGARAAPLREHVRSMPVKDPAAVGRAQEYVPRLVQHFLGE